MHIHYVSVSNIKFIEMLKYMSWRNVCVGRSCVVRVIISTNVSLTPITTGHGFLVKHVALLSVNEATHKAI